MERTVTRSYSMRAAPESVVRRGSGVCGARRSVVKSRVNHIHPRQETSMDPHHHREESNLKDGLLGIAIAVVGLVIIMAIAHFMAL